MSMIDKPSPSFEVALQEEFKRFYLAGIETGEKRLREKLEKDVEAVKKAVQETGTFKYDSCYDDCLNIIAKYKNGA